MVSCTGPTQAVEETSPSEVAANELVPQTARQEHASIVGSQTACRERPVRTLTEGLRDMAAGSNIDEDKLAAADSDRPHLIDPRRTRPAQPEIAARPVPALEVRGLPRQVPRIATISPKARFTFTKSPRQSLHQISQQSLRPI